MMSMDSTQIRKEKENGEAGRKELKMKKCFGCRQNLPLGSGRFHYFRNNNYEFENVPCTHNPVTGVAYNVLSNADGILWDKYCPGPRNEISIPLNSKCECGGETARTTHSGWCPKGGTK